MKINKKIKWFFIYMQHVGLYVVAHVSKGKFISCFWLFLLSMVMFAWTYYQNFDMHINNMLYVHYIYFRKFLNHKKKQSLYATSFFYIYIVNRDRITHKRTVEHIFILIWTSVFQHSKNKENEFLSILAYLHFPIKIYFS